MKKPKIDMSQDGLNKFFLLHVEKVILGLAIAALGYLFWNGWSTEKYAKTTPPKLSKLAKDAKTHIEKPSSWSDIAEFRAADSTAHQRIEDANKRQLDPNEYAVRRFLGTKRATLGLRKDPSLLGVTDLAAYPYRAPILLKITDTRYQSPLAQLPKATSADNDDGDSGNSDQRGEAGGGLGEGASGSDDDKDKDEEALPFGDSVPGIMAQEMLGFRPIATQQGTTPKYNPLVLDAVAVTGVVNFGEQFKAYESVFQGAIGYYPLRDRPQYLFMEVQRREYKENPENAEEYANSWKDISQLFVDDKYGVTQSPEVVSPESYDSTLTRNIPPLVNYDYRQLALHPKVDIRKLVPDGLARRNVVNKVDASEIEANVFDSAGADDNENTSRERDGRTGDPVKDKEKEIDDVENMKGNNRGIYDSISRFAKPKADYKLVRFFDYRATAGKTYEYRVRLWLNDPNDPMGFEKTGGTKRSSGVSDEMKGEFKGPSEAGGDDGGGNKNDDEEDLAKYRYVRVQDNLQDPSVRQRVRGKKDLVTPVFAFTNPKNEEEKKQQEAIQKELDEILSHAWATEWSQPTPPVKVGSNPADYYAGSANPQSVVRYDGFSIPREEKSVNLVTSFWSTRDSAPRGEPAYNTAIPVLKSVQRGDVLNLNVTKAHIFDPTSGDVRRLKDAKIKTDTVVVDLMGGEEVPAKFKMPVHLPSEVLVMDANGKFRLQNSFDDRTRYRHSLFLDDEDNTYGKARKKKKDDNGGGGSRPDF